MENHNNFTKISQTDSLSLSAEIEWIGART